MAKKLVDEDLVLNIIINGDKGQKELADLDKTVKDLSADNKKLLNDQKNLIKAGKEHTEEYKQLTAQIEKNDKAIQHAKARMDQLRQGMDLSTMSVRDLRKEQRKLRTLMDTTQPNTPLWRQYQARLKKVDAQLAKTRGQLKATKFSLKNMADGFNRYFSIIAAGFASMTGIVFGARKAVDAANLREEVRDDLQALTGLVDSEVQILMDAASRMSTSTVEGGIRITKSADDIANAYKLMGSQRPELLKNSSALQNVTTDAMILAEASKGKLEPSVRALAAVMNQFNEPASESRNIINSIASGSQAGAGDIEYIGTAMEKAGTSAELMNVSYQETIGLIEAMAPYYTKAEMAGNSLDKVLLKLKDKQIGYASGTFDMNDAIDQMREMFEAGTSASEIFGAEHAKMGELLVLNQENFNMYTEMVTGSNKAIEQASINTSNNSAKLAQAKNRIREISVDLGKKLQPAMTKVVSKGSMMLKLLINLVDFFAKYGGTIAKTVLAIGTYVTAQKAINLLNSKGIENFRDLIKVVRDQIKNISTYTQKIQNAANSQTKLNAAQKANLWGAVLSAITLATAALIKHIKKQTSLKRSLREANQAILEQSRHMNELFERTKNTNIGTKEREDLINQLNEEYGEYIPFQLSEISNNRLIALTQEGANDALARGILLKAKEAEITSQLKDIQEDQVIYTEKLTKALEANGISAGTSSEIIAELTRNFRAGDFVMKQETFLDATGAEYIVETVDTFTMLENAMNKVGVQSVELTKRKNQLAKESLALQNAIANENGTIQTITGTYDALISGYDNDINTEGKTRKVGHNLYEFKNGKWNPVQGSTRIAADGVIETFNGSEWTRPGSDEDPTKAAQKKSLWETETFQARIAAGTVTLKAQYQALSDYIKGMQQKQEETDDAFRARRIAAEAQANEMLRKLKDERSFLEDDDFSLDSDLEAELGKAAAQSPEAKKIAEQEALKKHTEEFHKWASEASDTHTEKLIANAELVAKKEQERLGVNAQLYQEFLGVLSSSITAATEGNEDALKEFGKTALTLAIRILKDQAEIAVAGVTISALTSPDSIATLGASGLLKAGVSIALIEAAFAGVQGIVNQWNTGKYPVVGANDGKTYNASVVPKLQTGIYAEPHLALFNENPSMPEMVIDGPTLQSIRINEPYILSAIQRNVVRQHADGLYPETSQPGVPVDPAMMAMFIQALQDSTNTNAQLVSEIRNGLNVSYDKIKKADAEMSTIYSKSSS